MTVEPMPIEAFARWLAVGEVGQSSRAIVSYLTGVPAVRGVPHPWDPSDFRRCERLLDAVPLARLAFPAMAGASAQWAVLVAHWDEMVALLDEECPDWRTCSDGHAPSTSARMGELLEPTS